MRNRALLFLALTICATAAVAAPATAFRVTLPSPVIYFQPFNFTVEAIDGTGTVDPGYTGTVQVTAPGDFQAVLPPNYTFTAGDAGVHVFTITLTVYGDNRTVTVRDVNTTSITGSDTTSVRYGPGATQRFTIAAPATGNLGEPFNFTITAADIDGNPTGDYTGTIEFQAHGVSVPSSYTFTPSDGGTKTFSGTPTRGGYVLFTFHDAAYPGVLGSHSMTIACPGFTVSASNDGPVCPNETPTLTASTGETGVTFEWQGPSFWFADGQVVSGTTNYEGPYTVRMSHPNGCTAFSTTEVALSSTLPDVQAVSDPLWICDTMEKTFTIVDEAENGPYTNIVWSLQDGVNASGTIVAGQGTTSVTVRGQYNPYATPYQWIHLRLSATNGAGCVFENLSAEQFELHQRPVSFIDTTANGCPGTTYNARPFGAPLPGNTTVTYEWSIENGTITEFNQTTGQILYNLSGEGDAVLTLHATSPYCSYTTTATVAAGPSASIASASYDICAGEAVQIPVVLTGQPPFTIAWSDGALQTGVVSSFTRTVMPNETTLYSIVSVSDANCSAGSSSGNVTVEARDDATITQQPASTAVTRGQRATLTVDVEPDATGIQWYRGQPGDRSQPLDGATSLVLTTPPITQNTTFWVEIETSCGNVMSNAATVNVEGRRRAVRHP